MQLSAFTVVDGASTPGGAATRDRYQEVFDLADAAEEGQLDALWIAEHHFHDGGLCPAPPVLLAACAARTRRIRLGVLVSVLPFHNPIEVAEQYAMVDQVSAGRLNLGLGSGYLATELGGFGVDPASKRERFDRAYEVVLRALQGEPVAWGGAEVRLNVRPFQAPYPPVWVAVQRREAIPFVGRRGVSIALVPYATLSGPEELTQELAEYRAALPGGIRGHASVALHLYAGDHPERARAALQRYLDSRLAHQSTFFAQKSAAHPEAATVEAIERQGFALFGSAEEVAEQLQRFSDRGVDEVLGMFDFGALHPRDVRGSVLSLGPRMSP